MCDIIYFHVLGINNKAAILPKRVTDIEKNASTQNNFCMHDAAEEESGFVFRPGKSEECCLWRTCDLSTQA